MKTIFHFDTPPGLTFEEAGHRYAMDALPVPSVTQIRDHYRLGPDFSGVSSYVMEAAAARGKTAHRAMALAVFEDLDWSTVDPSILLDVQAAYNALMRAGCEPWVAEQMIYIEQCRAAGTFDLFCLLYGHPAIVEYKFGLWKGVEFQTGGYLLGIRESLLRTYTVAELPGVVLDPKRYLLRVKGGAAKLVPITTREDHINFAAAARMWHLEREASR